MTEVGLRQMRQNASELVRRAQAGEQLTITVSGRPAAVLGPVAPKTWRTWSEISEIFSGPQDPTWKDDMATLDQNLKDPWG